MEEARTEHTKAIAQMRAILAFRDARIKQLKSSATETDATAALEAELEQARLAK